MDISLTDPRVQKVKHYNKHPSGVEAIEICRLMSFNLGNCMKYLFRLKDKDGPRINAQKALWYCLDEIAFRQPLTRLHNPEGSVIVRKTMRLVLDNEPDSSVRQCMRYVYLADITRDGYFFEQAKLYLSALVAKQINNS